MTSIQMSGASAMSAHEATEHDCTPCARLGVAAEQLRLAATALSALARLVDEDDVILQPHAMRLGSRAGELMRATLRLARVLGVSDRWGLEVLFSDPVDDVVVPPPIESIELEAIDLLAPLAPPQPPPVAGRPAQIPLPPWGVRVEVLTPPVATLTVADESTC